MTLTAGISTHFKIVIIIGTIKGVGHIQISIEKVEMHEFYQEMSQTNKRPSTDAPVGFQRSQSKYLNVNRA